MVEEKANTEKSIKKLEEFKDSEENKKVIIGDEEKAKKIKESSVSAIGKKIKFRKNSKKEIVKLEREYIVPLKKGILNVPQYRRAKKAVRILKEFMVRHMKVRDRDLKKVKIDIYLNNELWFRGIKKPANKIKVKAKKIDGIVYVELADIPEAVKYKMAWDKKQKNKTIKSKVKAPKKEKESVGTDKNKDGVDDKVEEKETKKAGGERNAKAEKITTKEIRHTTQGKHIKKTMPIRKSLKK